MTQLVMKAEEARALAAAALVRSHTSQGNAEAVARALVEAELVGQSGHGLRRVSAYAAQARAGKVNGFATPLLERPRPSVVRLDAANGFAFPALEALIEPLVEAAQAQGVAVGGILRSHHCGVAGTIVESYAERGLVALLFANTPAAMAPWGGARPLLGTNPIAFAAPLQGAAPIVVDTALSTVARGKIMAAQQTEQSIPDDWAFDRDGKPTTSPAAALAGSMAPLGGAKGVALALMVELLAAGLTGANFAYEATSFFDDKGAPPGVGQLLIVIDPLAFGPGATDRFGQLAAAIEAESGARVPGRRRAELRDERLRSGFDIDPAVVAGIEAIGRASTETAHSAATS